jgi:hypothetical protein
LYRADLVRSRDSFYTETNIHADTEACFDVLRESDFGFVHQVLTFTRVHPGTRSVSSADLQSDFAGMLRLLMTYGPHYLEYEELERLLKKHLKVYYRFLGKSVFLRRDIKFWELHKRSLREAGVGFKRRHVAAGLVGTLLDAVMNPKLSFGRLAAWNQRKRGA